MSISSDFTKVSSGAYTTSQPTQIAEQEFLQAKQRETQVVQRAADTKEMEDDSKSGNNLADSKDQKSDKVDAVSVEQANIKLRQLSVGLSFEMTEDGQKNIVKVVDQDTGDLVRQIPSEEFLAMSKRLDDIFGELNDLKGNLINSQV